METHKCASLFVDTPLLTTQMLCECLLLVLVLLAGDYGMVLTPLTPQGKCLPLRYPFEFSATPCGWGPSPFHVSILPTSFDVAPFVNIRL